MRRLHSFLEEMDEEWIRRLHRRRVQEMEALMSLSSGRDSADGSADFLLDMQSLDGRFHGPDGRASQCAGPGLLVPRTWFPCLRRRRTRSNR